ncbi:KAP family P-loop NTPase fold protein [Vibrio harveyi]|uniref:KAP family P-loop NTPase fold protein n=1 Tax=Vibrio harveyi TaxID=669 RepID=UPI00217E96AF|nr:KAP family NTPase [Vibrio harveyi]
MTSYHNDQPISRSQQDQLNRLSFSRSLAKIAALDADSPCLTISIEGYWGTGKTSIINLVKQSFDESPNPPIVVQYNPWVNGNPKSLIEDFLVQFTSQLGLADHPEKGIKVAKELLSYSKLFSVAKLIPGVEPFGSLVENIFKGVGEATNSLSDLKKLDVQAQKEKVVECLRNIDKPIVIIIDDIDRLTPNECFQVLRLVKVIADFPRTTFLLAFDPVYLQSVLAANNISNSSQYIDKIVQLRLPVPLITEDDLNTLVDTTLEQLGPGFTFEHYEDDRERFTYIYHRYIKKILESPRDVKRAVNHFKFVYQLVKHEVSTTDLFILSVLATKYCKIYEHIKSEPYQYTSQHNGKNFWLTSTDKEQAVQEAKNQRRKIYNSMGIPFDNAVEGLLEEIFPSIGRSFHYNSYGVDDADAAGRVDSIDRLSTALHIGTPRGLCSDEDVRRFIENAEENMDALESAIDGNATSRFLELYGFQLENKQHHPEHYIDNLSKLAEVLMANNLFNQPSDLFSDMFVEVSHSKALCGLVRKIVRIAEDKVASLNKAIDELALLPFVSESVQLMVRQHTGSSESPWISERDATAVFDTYSAAAEQAITKNQLNSKILEYHVISPLWVSETDTGKRILSVLNQNDVLRIGYLLIGEIGASSSNGTFLSVNLEKASSSIDVLALKEEAQTQLELTKDPLDRAILLSTHDGLMHYVSDGTIKSDF